nr:polysaccharide deacetylase family protein [Microvirga tunisiensis]
MPCECADATARRSVYLTFDDGPNPIFTPQIPDMLAKHRAPATFFVIGAYAAKHPELIRRIILDMPTVGNHAMTDPGADPSKCKVKHLRRMGPSGWPAHRPRCAIDARHMGPEPKKYSLHR